MKKILLCLLFGILSFTYSKAQTESDSIRAVTIATFLIKDSGFTRINVKYQGNNVYYVSYKKDYSSNDLVLNHFKRIDYKYTDVEISDPYKLEYPSESNFMDFFIEDLQGKPVTGCIVYTDAKFEEQFIIIAIRY